MDNLENTETTETIEPSESEKEPQWYDNIVSALIGEFEYCKGREEYVVMFVEFASNMLQQLENVINETNEYSAFELSWIKMASREMIMREHDMGLAFVTEYSENGYSVKLSGDYISAQLKSLITPRVQGW